MDTEAHTITNMDGQVHEDLLLTTSHSFPSFRSTSCSNTMWQDLTGEEFSTAIDNAYSRIVHWRQNLFKVPSGACGKCFVGELARLFEAFANESAYEAFAIKAAMTLPTLVLQKPNAKSKTHDHISCLQRRLELWRRGEIAEHLMKGTAIQRNLHLSSQRRDSEEEVTGACKFVKLMMEGMVRTALRLL